MKLNNEKWLAAVVKASKDLPQCGSSDGAVCALATLRIVRDALIEDIATSGADAKPETVKANAELAEEIKTSFSEMIQQVTSGAKLQGFASNASAAAKAAKLETKTLVGLEGLTD